MKKRNKYVDYFERTSYHPALDIKDGVFVLGFRIKPEKDREEDLYVVVLNGAVYTFNTPNIKIGDQHINIAEKNRKLEKLSSRWGIEELMTFIDGYSRLKIKEPNAQDIFQRITELTKKYVDLETNADYTILAAWIIGSYFFPAFPAFPFLNIKAPKGSGKTQCLNFLQQLCFNPMKARASLPALREVMDSIRGTYLMDQADSLHRNYNEDLCDILTDSYKRGGGQSRKMVPDSGGKTWKSEEFETYGPKVFASINQLPVDLRDRCAIVPLIRSGKNFPSPDDESQVWREVRGELYKLLITSHTLVVGLHKQKATEYRVSPIEGKVGRPLELWLPIETILHFAKVGKEDSQEADQRFFAQYGFAEYEVSDMEVDVISIVLSLFNGEEECKLSPRDIADQMDIGVDDFADIKQKSAKVGRIIKKYNLSTQKLNRNNKGERYLFKKKHVEKVAKGYGLSFVNNPTQSCTSTNSVTETASGQCM